ncbi:phospholipid scramblase 2-like [Littorina saxatilis]|uniref:phospholipid scramblase 2-like n=1 Tax=Littorina saxatilis TaxID=31220 RepID=UPI0038B6A505
MSHPAGPPPVVAQPGPVMQQQMVAMPPPPPVPGCPPGLEYLAQLDQVMVEQEVHMLEVLTGFEVKNKFRIMNSQNQQVYYAAEESGTLMRICCGPSRGFVYHITDNFNQVSKTIYQKVILFSRKFHAHLCNKIPSVYNYTH